jgi:hypothetical protein
MDPLVKEIKSNQGESQSQALINSASSELQWGPYLHGYASRHQDQFNRRAGQNKDVCFVLFNIQRQVLFTLKIQCCFPGGSTAQHACMLLHQAIIIHGLDISIKLKK